MSGIEGVSGTIFSAPSSGGGGGGVDAKIEALQKRIQEVMEEIKELTGDQSIDPKIKVKLLEAKQALVQAYQMQIMNIMNQEAQKATMEAMADTELIDQISPAGAPKDAQEAKSQESAIVHIDRETLDAARELSQEEDGRLLPENQQQEEIFDMLLDRNRESISEYA